MELASITISGRLKKKKKEIVKRIFVKPINLTTILEIRKIKKWSYARWRKRTK